MVPDKMNREILEDLSAKWESLDITSNFIFYRVMRDNEDLCLELLRIIFPDLDIKGIAYHTMEKTIEETFDSHGVRLDVFVCEAGADRMYNVEMQAGFTDDLKKRSRYNQAMVDQEYLDKGCHYSQLRDSYIVFICTFDLFGKNRCKYSFTYNCEEVKGLKLGDGTTRVFLNTRGAREKASPELAAFLDYCAGKGSDDTFVKRLDDAVSIVKKNKEERHRFMTVEMMLRGERLKAEEALAEKDAVIESLEKRISEWEQEKTTWTQEKTEWAQEKTEWAQEKAELLDRIKQLEKNR